MNVAIKNVKVSNSRYVWLRDLLFSSPQQQRQFSCATQTLFRSAQWKSVLQEPHHHNCQGSLLRLGAVVPSVFPFPGINYQPRRNAGHSKWANIKHVKQANDQARSRETTKFMGIMRVAVREQGSADPKVNSKLAQVLAQVKAAKLPLAPFERALQSLQTQKATSHCIHPLRGPGNCILLVELESPNLAKSKMELNSVLKKNRGMVTDDTVLYMFDHKGLLYCSGMEGTEASAELLDDATMHAIEVGATDVMFIEDHPEHGKVFEFTTAPSSFFKVKNALEDLKYRIEHAEVAYVPKQPIELEDTDLEAANKLYLKLTEHEDVQNVFVNIA